MNNSIDKLIGNTRLLKIKLLSGKDNSDNNNEIWGKMEGDNPSGSLKDRAALGMILGAEKRKKILNIFFTLFIMAININYKTVIYEHCSARHIGLFLL